MKIQDNKLVGVPFRRSPNQSGSIVPKYLVIHYDGASNSTSGINWMLDPASKVSAHIHIDRKGNVVQLVEFNKRAYHAGRSFWKGLSDLNWHSIGIELENPGNLEYTKSQLDALVEVSKAIVNEYGIKEDVGHSDISPGRKVDPGYQFPWDWYRQEVFGSNGYVPSFKTTTALNLRSDAGTFSDVITVLPEGAEVLQIEDHGEWLEVIVCADKLRGYVSKKYLK